MKFACPNCFVEYDREAVKTGQKARCSHCQKVFTISPSPIKCSPKVPFEKLPPPPPTPKYQEKPALLKKLWSSIPSVFRTAFIATLGVVCALWFALNVMGVGRKLTSPVNHTLQSPPAEIQVDDKTEYLAAATALIQIHAEYKVLHNLRISAAQNAVNDLDFGITIKHLKIPLEQLYLSMQDFKLPDQPYIEDVYNSLLRAIDNEYTLVNDTIVYISNPDSLSAKGAFQKAIKDSEHAQTESGLGVAVLLMQIDDNFWDAYIKVLNEK